MSPLFQDRLFRLFRVAVRMKGINRTTLPNCFIGILVQGITRWDTGNLCPMFISRIYGHFTYFAFRGQTRHHYTRTSCIYNIQGDCFLLMVLSSMFRSRLRTLRIFNGTIRYHFLRASESWVNYNSSLLRSTSRRRRPFTYVRRIRFFWTKFSFSNYFTYRRSTLLSYQWPIDNVFPFNGGERTNL